MSSGLPVNTFNQAAEYRKRYLATLALQAQNDYINLQANQVYKQTGQPSRPPDMRTTTEKLADIERLKVDLRAGLMAITDGTNANEIIENLDTDEIIFATQKLPFIVSDIKPKYARGIPANAFLAYLDALRRRELMTNGVSFTAQETTARDLIRALENGQRAFGGSGGPFGIGGDDVLSIGSEFMPGSIGVELGSQMSEPESSMAVEVGEEEEEPEKMGTLRDFKRDPRIQELANLFQFYRIGDFEAYPTIEIEFPGYPTDEPFMIEFLKMWARNQDPSIQSSFIKGWNRKKTLRSLKQALLPGVNNLMLMNLFAEPEEGEILTPTSPIYKMPAKPARPVRSITEETIAPSAFTGSGIRHTAHNQAYRQVINSRRPMQPHSRFPTGREILGYGLSSKKSPSINIDMTKGLAYVPKPVYIPFGKYILNHNKLSSGILDLKTIRGSPVKKYPTRSLGANLSKVLNRIVGGRIPDQYDIEEMDLDEQNFLYNLAQDSNIMDRLKLPTPKRSKEGEETNRFEILKGQIIAGNDNKDLVKEFKTMVVKFSNDGRLKKSEAREILLDLAALGH